jgi:serine/threonine-protein kinase RsbW
MGKQATLRIAADLENLTSIRRFIEEAATALGVAPAAIPDLVLATDEAITNIIVHGYQGQQGPIKIEVERDGDRVAIRLHDQAHPFDPTTFQPPDMTLPLEQRPIGGMGIYLIRQSVDELTYRVLPQGGNELTLAKTGIGGQE